MLDDGGSLVATAITNANGNYFFSSNPDLTTTANAIYNLNLNFEETYTIRIPNAVGNSQQGVLDTYEITAQNNDATINGDSRDSDGSQTENSDINIILGQAGDNNHTYDFGFKIAAVCSIDNVDLTNTNCQDPLTPTEPNDDRIQFFITVSGTDLSTAGYTVSMTQNGTPLIVAPDANGEYDTNEMFRTQNGFAGNGDLIVTITDNDDASCTAQITINDTGTCSTTPLCPVLSNISQTSDICSSTCVPSFSVSTDQTDGSIDFVYFTSQQTGSDMYVSGTLIGNATIQTNGNAILTPASGTGFSFPANTSTLPITYYVYAIISPSPTDVSCRPSLETTVIVQPNPDVSITTNPSCNTDGTFNLGITIVESGNFTIEFADNFSQVNCGLITAQNVAATFSSTGNNTENIFTVVEGTYNILITNNDTNCRTLIDGPIGENNCDCSPKKCIRVVLTKK